LYRWFDPDRQTGFQQNDEAMFFSDTVSLEVILDLFSAESNEKASFTSGERRHAICLSFPLVRDSD
jgi:hypothetical protein